MYNNEVYMDPVSVLPVNPMWIAITAIVAFFIVALLSGYFMQLKAYSIAEAKNSES